MKNKKVLLAVLAIALVMVFVIGCSNGTSDETNDKNNPVNNDPKIDPTIGSLKSVKNRGVKSLFTSNVSINNGTSRGIRASAETGIDTLFYINDAGQNAPLIFLTSNDKEVLLQISNAQKVGKNMLVADYSAVYEIKETDEDGGLIYINSIFRYGRTLINMETGVLYDFSGYTNEFLVDGNTLYVIKEGGTLYKIALANLGSAIPLNNPQYNKVQSLLLKIGNKIICYGGSNWNDYYSFDVNASFVPKQVKPVQLSFPFYLGNGNGIDGGTLSTYRTYFIDSNNDFWFYFIAGLNSADGGSDVEKYYFTCKLAIDDEGQLSISERSDGSLSFITDYFGDSPSIWSNDGSSRYYLTKEGIVIAKKKPSGVGIVIEGISKTISDRMQDAFIHGDFLYWINGTSIKRMELFSSGTEETIYSNSNIVNTSYQGMLFNSGEKIIFYQYLDATTVGTYSLTIGDLFKPPNLVSTSTMEIGNIIELQF
jgi:hypothetical protein